MNHAAAAAKRVVLGSGGSVCCRLARGCISFVIEVMMTIATDQ